MGRIDYKAIYDRNKKVGDEVEFMGRTYVITEIL